MGFSGCPFSAVDIFINSLGSQMHRLTTSMNNNDTRICLQVKLSIFKAPCHINGWINKCIKAI
jgi:hypothetical protein